jgi:hypothetical protein
MVAEMAMQCLQHEAVTTERDDRVGLLRVHIPVLAYQSLVPCHRVSTVTRDERDSGKLGALYFPQTLFARRRLWA